MKKTTYDYLCNILKERASENNEDDKNVRRAYTICLDMLEYAQADNVEALATYDTSRDKARSIGGLMVKRMIEAYEKHMN